MNPTILNFNVDVNIWRAYREILVQKNRPTVLSLGEDGQVYREENKQIKHAQIAQFDNKLCAWIALTDAGWKDEEAVNGITLLKP